MPWQQMVADIGGELDPVTGLPCYREVVVTVPRQNGKTHLLLAWEIQRALGWDTPQRIVYSAQTGLDARKKLVEDQLPIIEPRRSKLGVRRVLRGMGSEGVEFTNGSRIVLMASQVESGHGKTVDLAVKDEFFADVDDRRDQALVPAMATRANAQVVTTSTAGTDLSVPLNRLVTRGRQATLDGRTDGVAYFEWSASEDDDPDDPATWARVMPALGFTITPVVVQHARETLTHDEFLRAFLNVSTRSDEHVIPAATWDLVNAPDASPTGMVALALDVNVERSAGAIVAVGGGVVEVIEHRPGVRWIVPRAAELAQRWRASVTVDSTGPAGALVGDLEAAGIGVRKVQGREFAAACGAFYDAVVERAVTIRRHPSLDAAVAAATRRTTGDAWTWARRSTTADISPLVAATLAAYGESSAASVYETRGMSVV